MMVDRRIKAIAKKVLPEKYYKEIREKRKINRFESGGEPATYRGLSTYTIVTAVYNAERYLDAFFDSIIAQSFCLSGLKIIAVDDGSTDSSLSILRSWEERYPEIISVLTKENGGQASARNFALSRVETDWVTFIDPDDFVSKDYFKYVDQAVRRHPALKMISCSMVFYKEAGGTYSDSHALRHYFAEDESIYNIQDETCPIQLSMASAFFLMSEIEQNSLRVSIDVRPNFEDGLFVGEYLNIVESGQIAFLKKPKYFYRKRSSEGSTMDLSWAVPEKINCVPVNGYLRLIDFCIQKRGYVPLNIQHTVLYELQWYLKYYLGRPERWQFASASECQQFHETLEKIMARISNDYLFNMPGRELSFRLKSLLSMRYQGIMPKREIVYIRRIDSSRNYMVVQAASDCVRFYLDGTRVHPVEKKHVGQLFFDEMMPGYVLYVLPFDSSDQALSASAADNVPVDFSVKGGTFKGTVAISQLWGKYAKAWSKYPVRDGSWVIMDRNDRADDNGEHLYRWMRQHHPEVEAYFALGKDSPDWRRLKEEGFKLLEYGSKRHESRLRSCSYIVSSQADAFVTSYFGDNYENSKRIVFLQHGVIKDDLSGWLNGKPLSLFVTSTRREYESIIGDYTQYAFTSDQVKLLGLPRYDALLEKARTSVADVLMIMPTWRRSLAGARPKNSAKHFVDPAFIESEYKRRWEQLLSSDAIVKIACEGTRIVFFPHPNMKHYVDAGLFTVPDHVELAGSGVSIQDYLSRSKALITDYSSVAFDAAYLGKEVLYYQFDRDEFFSGMQIFSRGYYDYETDSFGPVCHDEHEMDRELRRLAENEFKIEPKYAKRIHDEFGERDGGCCERVFNEIAALGSLVPCA